VRDPFPQQTPMELSGLKPRVCSKHNAIRYPDPAYSCGSPGRIGADNSSFVLFCFVCLFSVVNLIYVIRYIPSREPKCCAYASIVLFVCFASSVAQITSFLFVMRHRFTG
jgi:hypothetical protein